MQWRAYVVASRDWCITLYIESTQKYLLQTPIVPDLIGLLDAANGDNIVKLSAWLCANLSSEAKNSRNLCCAGAIMPMVSLLESENEEIVSHCCEAFRNFFTHDRTTARCCASL